MKYFLSLILFFLSMHAFSEYDFKDYQTEKPLNIALEEIPISIKKHRSLLEREIGSRPNFSSKYILTGWGCGTQCQGIAAIDVETGEVFYPGKGVASNGICFQESSRLLIVNPITKEGIKGFGLDTLPSWYYIKYYELTDNGFKLLKKSKQPLATMCTNKALMK